jgi:hypothetical protein
MGKLVFLPNVPLTISTGINYIPSFEEDIQEYWRIQQLVNRNPKIKTLTSRIYTMITSLLKNIMFREKVKHKMDNIISNKEFNYNRILKEMIKLGSEGKEIPEELRKQFWETIDDDLKDENGRIKVRWTT